MRLGDLDELLQVMSAFEPIVQGRHDGVGLVEHGTWAGLCEIVKDAPTIDAVPVAQLREMLSNLESKCCGDGAETYTTGYRNGHHNGQIELLRYILQVPDGTSEDTRKDGGKE